MLCSPQLIDVYHGLDAFLRIAIHRQVGISDWGKFGQDGVEEKVLSFPYRQNSWIFNRLQNSWLKKLYRLRFHPTGNITFSDNYVRPTNQDLVTIPSGSVLYQVVTRQHRRLNSIFVDVLVELTNIVFVHSTNISTNIETEVLSSCYQQKLFQISFMLLLTGMLSMKHKRCSLWTSLSS